ncbi:MAG TPA: endonuclease MutS2 [Bacteroidota bacterium]|nr:endonuclease MutS2 [Bacteroidota bacterium]
MQEHLNAFAKLEFDKIKKHIQRYAFSAHGKEHVAQLTPSSSLTEIRTMLSEVTEMKRLINEDDMLPLDADADIRTSLRRASIENYTLSAEELRMVVQVLENARRIHSYFVRRTEHYPLLSVKCASMYADKVLEYNINQAIDTDGTVKDSASKDLSVIRRQIEDRKLSLRRHLEQLLRDVAEKEWAQEDIITTREGRMVIPIKTEHKNRVPGFIHSTSASGATVFIEPTATLDLNNDVCTLQFQEQREIARILADLTKQVREHSSEILEDSRIIGELDFIQAKAKYSTEILASEPQVGEEGAFQLRDARHPLLLQSHKREHVVPLTIDLGGEVNTLLITGPNAGGKSVAMKTVGLLAILTQAGCHISAASESRIRIFTDLFVDMGDEQSIENDLSSFSSHLQNIKEITERANSSSLILIDEIASGTDPVEGASIAAAVLEYLSKTDCTTIATTHHGALKAFAFKTPRFENGAMEFNSQTLEPTYRFRAGVPGSSYGIEMAKRMHLERTITDSAVSFRGEESNKLETLILDLETKAQELKKKLDDAEQERERYSILNQLYVDKISLLQKELNAIKAKALLEGQEIIDQAKSTVEKTVREIRETSAEKRVVRSAKEELKKIEADFKTRAKEVVQEEPQTVDFRVGDVVRLKDGDSEGEIIEQLDNDHFVVMVGAFKLNAQRGNLQKSASKSVPRKPVSSGPELDTSEVKNEIDLRGMFGEEALTEIDKYFDKVMLAGLHRVRVIHGKGTGALRRKITDYLKNNASVKSFHLGEWNEGGTGVTIVEL